MMSCMALTTLVSALLWSADNQIVVYVSVSGENRIAVFDMDAQTGSLTLKTSTPVEGSPGSLGVDPTCARLYAAIRSTGSVATLKIDPKSGKLEPVAVTKAVENPVYVCTDATGRWLLTSYYGAHKAAVFPIDDKGTVLAKPAVVLETKQNPHSIQADPSNRFAFVPNTGSDVVSQFRFDAETGTLQPNEPAQVQFDAGSGPRHFTFHPSGRFVYFVNEKNSSVTACRFDGSSGQLQPFQSLSTLPDGFTGQNTCADIHVTPSGRFVYASNRGHDSLAGFEVDEKTGAMRSLGQTPTEKTPREFAIDPTGQFVYSAGQASGKLASYRIDQNTGRLEPLKVYPIGAGPAWVSVVTLPK